MLINGIYIILLHAKKIPPHLAIAIDGRVFSLSVNGPKINGKMSELISMIQSKAIKTLFFQLSEREDYTTLQLIEKMKKLTLAYSGLAPLFHGRAGLDAGGVTCLNPIKEFCRSVYKTNIAGVNFIFDLLPELGNEVIARFHLNMESCLSEGVFYLKKYTMEDINNMIRRLQPGKIP